MDMDMDMDMGWVGTGMGMEMGVGIGMRKEGMVWNGDLPYPVQFSPQLPSKSGFVKLAPICFGVE